MMNSSSILLCGERPDPWCMTGWSPYVLVNDSLYTIWEDPSKAVSHHQSHLKMYDGFLWNRKDQQTLLNDTLLALKFLQDHCDCFYIVDNVSSLSVLLHNDLFTHHHQQLIAENTMICHLSFRRPRYAICSLFIGEAYQKKITHCIRSKYEYAQYYRYKLITHADFIKPTTSFPSHPAWVKCLQLSYYLPQYDFLFWIDGDAMITNLFVCLDSFFLLLKQPYLNLISCDQFSINSGVMLLRNCPETLHVFRSLPRMKEEWLYTTCFEQKPLIEIIQSNFIPHLFQQIPSGKQYVWNAYEKRTYRDPNAFREGDFILHFAGYNVLNNPSFQLQESDMMYGSLYIDFFPFPFERFESIILKEEEEEEEEEIQVNAVRNTSQINKSPDNKSSTDHFLNQSGNPGDV